VAGAVERVNAGPSQLWPKLLQNERQRQAFTDGRRGFPQGDQSAVDNSESFLPRAALGVLSEERAKMISRDLRFSAQIHGSPEMIFDLVADMPNYDRWLPDSSAFGGTVDVTPYPVRLGTTYLDAGPVLKPGL